MARAERPPADWEAVQVLHRGRLGMHVPLRCYESVATALAPQPGDAPLPSTNVLSLSPARWMFAFAPSIERAPTPSEAHGGYDLRAALGTSWGTIDVPLSWQMASHGAPIYTNFVYPFNPTLAPADEATWDVRPLLPPECNSAGCYETTFELPARWAGRRIILHIGAVESAAHVWVDGSLVGYSTDSRLPAEFDVTALLSAGGERRNGGIRRTHTVSLRVYRLCAASYLEDQDHWWLSGIHRDVHLFAKRADAAIVDYAVNTELWWPEDGRAARGGGGAEAPPLPTAARIHVDVSLLGDALQPLPTGAAGGAASGADGGADGEYAIAYELHGPFLLGRPPPAPRASLVASGKCEVLRVSAAESASLAALATSEWRAHTLAAACGARAVVDARLSSPRLWSAEEPYLYRLVLSLRTRARPAEARDVEACWVGLKEVSVRAGRLELNRMAITLRGVNRHDHCPERGKAMDRALMLRDAVLIKRFNFNAVRTAHYPAATAWMDLCDAYGLYVVDEANIETHGFVMRGDGQCGFLARRPAWRAHFVARGARMVARDRNHACVLVWSLANEAGIGPNLAHEYAQLKAMDPSRPVQYEQCGALPYTDIICPMYPSAAKLRELGTARGQAKPWAHYPRPAVPAAELGVRPVVMCEYSHAMGNSNGNFAHFWRVVREVDCVQGGFVWDWCDQGLALRGEAAARAREGSRAWAYGGDFGEKLHDAQFNINGLVWPDRTPHPACWEVKRAQQPISFELAGWCWRLAAAPPAPPADAAGARGVMLLGDGRLILTSTLDFACVSAELVTIDVCVRLRGRAVDGTRSSLPVSRVPPHARAREPVTVSVELPLELAARALAVPGPKGASIHLDVTARLARDAPWAPAGHELAFAQFALPRAPCVRAPPAAPPAAPSPRAAGAGRVLISGGATSSVLRLHTVRGSVTIERATGMIVNVTDLAGRERLASPFALNFWRAPTDNDRGGVELHTRLLPYLPRTLALAVSVLPTLSHGVLAALGALSRVLPLSVNLGAQVSFATLWAREGWARLEPRDVTTRVEPQPDGSVSVHTSIGMVDGASGAPRVACRVRTLVSANGHAWLRVTCDVSSEVSSVPRVGLCLGVREAFGAAVSWLGRGPHENYDDRKEGAPIAQHALPAAEMHTPYIVPGENGLRSDVQWLALRNGAGSGLLLAGQPDMMASVSPFGQRELERATHDHELVPSGKLSVCLDHRHMGVGGDDSWSRTVLPNYWVPAGRYSWAVGVRTLEPGEDADEAAREVLLAAPRDAA
ncbi:hypothetical protein KFE25_000185 [Diacronema lutheri]|uniref:beta-galactosidase n=1 Tax=Diacronema lutheri TaxID=2081491 RepID=A0A8J6C6Z5_DIALT|nr:hypothetical protein KFE25_000185 [Diacronema lutheri]